MTKEETMDNEYWEKKVKELEEIRKDMSFDKKIYRAERMTELYNEGYTYKRIAHIYGLSKERVRQLVTQYKKGTLLSPIS